MRGGHFALLGGKMYSYARSLSNSAGLRGSATGGVWACGCNRAQGSGVRLRLNKKIFRDKLPVLPLPPPTPDVPLPPPASSNPTDAYSLTWLARVCAQLRWRRYVSVCDSLCDLSDWTGLDFGSIRPAGGPAASRPFMMITKTQKHSSTESYYSMLIKIAISLSLLSDLSLSHLPFSRYLLSSNDLECGLLTNGSRQGRYVTLHTTIEPSSKSRSSIRSGGGRGERGNSQPYFRDTDDIVIITTI